MDLDTFRKSVNDSMFETSSAFQKEILYKDLDLQELENSSALRACCVFMHYELVDAPAKCNTCKASCTLEQGRSSNELFWLCSQTRKKDHFKRHISIPCLPKVRTNNLLGFLHFVVFMLCNEKIKRIVEELKSAHGIARCTVFHWEKIYHEALSKYVKKKNLNKVGGNKERCAVDETAVGKVGRMVGKPASKKGSFVRAGDRIGAKRPCKTLWKPKAKAFPKAKAGSSKDKRSNKSTQWLWLAVQTGKDGQQPRSHKDGSKKVAMDVLPDASQAPKGKPRGEESLTTVFKSKLRKGTKVTADGWKSTTKVAKKLKMPIKTVNHNKEFRAADGTHTHDAESEVAKFKLWSRGKWSKVRTLNSKSSEKKQKVLKSHVDEYVAQSNLGIHMKLKMSDLMEAFRLNDGGRRYKPVKMCC